MPIINGLDRQNAKLTIKKSSNRKITARIS